MLLFREWHIKPILDGSKTQTRRLWKKQRVKEGSIQLFKTKMFSKEFFAKAKILLVRQEKVGDISELDARAEGAESKEAFWEAIAEINGCSVEEIKKKVAWVVYFKVVEVPCSRVG